jgi:hypothetical protein
MKEEEEKRYHYDSTDIYCLPCPTYTLCTISPPLPRDPKKNVIHTCYAILTYNSTIPYHTISYYNNQPYPTPHYTLHAKNHDSI